MAAAKFARRDGRWGRIRGNWATLILPISDDDSIDFARLADEIDHLIATGVDGIYSNGTAGEFHNQTEEEFDAIQLLLAGRCKRAAMPFIIGACQADPRISLERVRRAARLEPEAIQVILPDWWPVTTTEATDFLRMAVEAAGSIPLVLYHPPHAKRVFTPAELAAILTPVPEVVGVKLADGDLSWYEQARQHLGAWGIYVPGHHLATGVKQGVAVGAFSNVACLNPSGAQRWTASMASNIERALDVEQRLRTFLEVHITPLAKVHGYSNAALDKLLAAIGGWTDIGTRLRRPYRWLDPGIVSGLREKAKAALPEIML